MLWRASLVFRSQPDKSASECPVQIQVEVVGLALFHWQWPPFALVICVVWFSRLLYSFVVCMFVWLFACNTYRVFLARSWCCADSGYQFLRLIQVFFSNFVALLCWLILFIASVRVKYCKLWIHWHRICRQACSALFLSPGILWNVNKIIKLWEICQLLCEWLTCEIPSDDKEEIMTVWRRRILEDIHIPVGSLYLVLFRFICLRIRLKEQTARVLCVLEKQRVKAKVMIYVPVSL